MKNSSQKIKINHSPKDLFNIVLDIEKYPEFIPWCSNIIIISKNDKEIIADMIVKYNKLFPLKFSSHVLFNKKKLFIKTNYIKGPLKDLKTEWIFKEIESSITEVTFKIEFEFKKFLHQKVAEFFYKLIEDKMIESFKRRADSILN
ncbi:MAG: hypothetical protein CFH19_00511 [Alphaproteobacteria bacterium MarineAlpha5_Bin9]|nr:MAG: hypothetical protein CFH19_00511 [Alphaproteobacteria bacterium MarineAlpha5_Bin9]|tara:strand:+ start:389 stop:826 length:438 start_codon:yes stop_codon:yes gene_type:complete